MAIKISLQFYDYRASFFSPPRRKQQSLWLIQDLRKIWKESGFMPNKRFVVVKPQEKL